MRAVRRFALASTVAAAGAAAAIAVSVLPAAPAAAANSSPPSPAHPARLAVGVEVLRFNAGGRNATGTGLVTATLTGTGGATQTIRSKVAVVASTSGGCKILHLYLNQLNLVLLGLTVHLDKVVLDITGNQHGGVLGALFCKLATAKISSARASAARALNARIAHNRAHVLRFKAYFTPKATATAANPTCQVLDLIVGPLNLQLLGLVVNLNQVHLTITATNGAGVLGNLFCSLANATVTG